MSRPPGCIGEPCTCDHAKPVRGTGALSPASRISAPPVALPRSHGSSSCAWAWVTWTPSTSHSAMAPWPRRHCLVCLITSSLTPGIGVPRMTSAARGCRTKNASGRRAAEQAAHRGVELAPYEAHEAVHIGLLEVEPAAEEGVDPAQQRLAAARHPACGGGAMDAVDLRDPVDAQPVDEVQPQRVALVGGQLREGILERLRDLAPVVRLEKGELWIGRAAIGRAIGGSGHETIAAPAREEVERA